MIKIVTVFGTRPEAIKLAPVVRELSKYPDKIESRVVVTSQHRDLLDTMLDVFGIEPDADLNIMREGQSLTYVTAIVLDKISAYLTKNPTDILIVQGDTTTTFASAMAAFYHRVDVGHVEAGLRSGKIYDPFPEEFNRTLIGNFAEFNFAPTESNKQNLLDEGVVEDKVYVTGNTAIDSLLNLRGKLSEKTDIILPKTVDEGRLILMTAHRRESFGGPLIQIFEAVREIADANPDVYIVYPVHPNPNVRETADLILGNHDRIDLIEPQDYLSFIYLMEKSYLIMTDSGGIQEEAPSLGKPVLVYRNVTERNEAIEAGTVKLVGTRKEDIIEETQLLLDDEEEYKRMARAINPYGDGHAAEQIVSIILENYSRYVI